MSSSTERPAITNVTNLEFEETPNLPSVRYQTLLLASGFLMTFHVIGINSVFGIFQVSLYLFLRLQITDKRRNCTHLSERAFPMPSKKMRRSPWSVL